MRKYSALEEETLVLHSLTLTILIILLGAAYLVKNKAEGKEYIAKKILLG